MKNDKTVFYIIGGVFLVALITFSQIPKEEGMISLTPHYYKDGVEVFPIKGLFSIVTPFGKPPFETDQILFDISGTAGIDTSFSNIQIVDADPPEFKEALLHITPQSLNRGQTKKLWGEGDYVAIDTVQFEGQTINFWVNISAVNDYTRETVYADVYSGDIKFEAESQTTESFFGELFSIITLGGQTYHLDSNVEKVSFSPSQTRTFVNYFGSGYLTGMSYVSTGLFSCKLFIDGVEYLNLQAPRVFSLNYIDSHNIVRFENSLKVECTNDGTTSESIYDYSVSYMID